MTLDPREQARLDEIEHSLHMDDARLAAWATGRGARPPRSGPRVRTPFGRRSALVVGCVLLPGVLLFAAAFGPAAIGVVVAVLVLAPLATFVLDLQRAQQADPPSGTGRPKHPG